MNPLFSVIMPLYNKAPYVKKALESVVSQTRHDWELIIVDDGSTDDSASICRHYLSSFPCPLSTRLLQQPNAGVAAARNKGVEMAQGTYITFLDADDWWEQDCLEQTAQLIAEYPDAGIYAANYIYYKPGKTHIALNIPRGYMDYPKTYYEGNAMPIWTGATCMPRQVFQEMGGFPAGIKLGEDFLLWAKTSLRYPVAFCDKPLAYYNNDVPPSLRATRNLYAPHYHMLFCLEPIEQEVAQAAIGNEQKETWQALFDRLRVTGLMDYWLNDAYHHTAAKELAKVNWSKQPQSVIRTYNTPIWLLKQKRLFRQLGSYCKQKLIKVWA